MAAHRRGSRHRARFLRRFVEALEGRRLLTAVTLDPGTTYQTIQGWGSAPLYPDGTPIATVGTIMRDAGMNVVRVTAGPGDLTYNKSGDLTTPVPLSSDLDANVSLFGGSGMTQEVNLVKWLMTNGLQPDRVKMTGSLWSPPNWLKIPTGDLITWTNWDGTTHNDYGPFLPYGQYGGNTGGGRVDPNKYTDLATFVLSDIKAWQQQTGLPMYAFSFQNEPDVETFYSSASYSHIAKDPNDLSQGYNSDQWQLYANALQAIGSLKASHPEITTKLYGPEQSSLGPSPDNPWFISEYNQIRQQMIANGSLSYLGGYAIHGYESPSDGEAALWDAFYNGSAHAAMILSGGSSNVLGWLWPVPGVAGDNKEIWQTETGSEGNTWTNTGSLGYGLKILNALVYGNVSGYTVWELASGSSGDTSALVNYGDLNNPTNSFNYDAMKQFSRWIPPGSQRIKAVFDNGNASIGGANSLDTYNALNVSAFNDTLDKRLTTVFVNMQASDQSTTITLPAGLNISSFQVYQTTGTQKYVQLSELIPSNGQISITIPASSIVTITGSYSIVTNAAPTVATAATATPNPVTATSVNLSVLGADDNGESNLSYNWSLIGSPPASVLFSANGTNAAKNTTATFTQAGTYQFQVVITDAGGLTATSTVNVNVGFGAFTNSVDVGAPTTPGSLSYVPATGIYTIQGGGADVWGTSDQFRFSYASLTGNGTASARVTSATNTNASAKSGIMYRNSTAANASYAYAWIGPNGGAHFETRSANGSSSSYSANGTGGNPAWVRIIRSGASSNQFAAYVSVNGTTWTQIGVTQTITMSSTVPVGLAVTSHDNTAGVLNTSTFDNVSIGTPPTVATPAAATPSPVTGTTTSLSVLGADDGGEPALSYTWATTGMPPAPVGFSLNGTNPAKSTLASFTKSGNYNFLVTITDSDGLSVTSSVAVTVNQTPTTVTVAPGGLTLAGGTTQQYAASALDQFNQAISSPSFSWSATGGTISSSGLYSPGQAGGNFSVTATCGSAQGSASLSIVPTLYSGASGADQYYLQLSGSTLNIWLGDGTGSPTYSIAYSSVPSLSFNGYDGDDTLTVDCSAGNVIPSGGITFDGGNGTDTLKLIGTPGDDTVTADASSVSLGRTINTPNVEKRSFAGGAGQDSLAITGGSWSFDSDTLLTTLSLSNSASATVTAGGANDLQLTNLSIDPTSTLDLGDNNLIVRGGDVGSWNGSAYIGITGLIASGRNGGAWDGTGIKTSQAQAGAQLTTLAVATAGSVQKTTFAGVPVSATDLLVMYTYAGDATLDGKINVDDYIRIDSGIAGGLTGYGNGDFNYDGKINIDDYTVIDANIGTQGPAFPNAASVHNDFAASSAMETAGDIALSGRNMNAASTLIGDATAAIAVRPNPLDWTLFSDGDVITDKPADELVGLLA